MLEASSDVSDKSLKFLSPKSRKTHVIFSTEVLEGSTSRKSVSTALSKKQSNQ